VDNGKGGAVYLDLTNIPSGFASSSLSITSFSLNGQNIEIGKDMYIKANNLSDTVEKYFLFAMSGSTNRGFSLAGEGTVYPFSSMDDLYFFPHRLHCSRLLHRLFFWIRKEILWLNHIQMLFH
jgi:hypothetical protein